MTSENYLAFKTQADLDAWLRTHHSTETVLWVRIYKKGSDVPSVVWNDCVVAALAWGWIDGQKQSLDEVSYLQRMTPRRKGSNWSKRNVEHVEKLIADNKMQPAGMAHVDAAKEDGRWAAAYAGSADMVIPEDFLAELEKDPVAIAHYETLSRSKLFVIYHRLNSAKRPETRQKRLTDFLEKLSRREDIS